MHSDQERQNERESDTLTAMIRIYCEDHHGREGALCEKCRTLREYAANRVEHCVFGDQKPVCSKCPVHCYHPEMRERIREVMRYSGPRMMLRHPVLTMGHLLDKRKPVPERKRKM